MSAIRDRRAQLDARTPYVNTICDNVRNTKRVHDARYATRVTRRVITSRETTNVGLGLCLEVRQLDNFDENFNSFVYVFVLDYTYMLCNVRVVRFLNVN